MKHLIQFIDRRTKQVVREFITYSQHPVTTADDLYRRYGGPHLTVKVEYVGK
jgi:hypothetical protein